MYTFALAGLGGIPGLAAQWAHTLACDRMTRTRYRYAQLHRERGLWSMSRGVGAHIGLMCERQCCASRLLCKAVPPTANIPPQRSICLHVYCYPMQLEDPNSQNVFLNTARKERKRVQVYLVNGIRLIGSIESFDQFVVMLSTPGGMQAIYKRAISTIQLDTGARHSGSGTRPTRVTSDNDTSTPPVVMRKRRPLAAGGGEE